MLRSGCRWRDLDRPGSPSGFTHWRRFRYWYRRSGYRQVWRTPLNLLVHGKRLDRSLVSLDGTLIPSQEFMEQTGYLGKHRLLGTKLSLLVDRAGIPLAVNVAPGNYHDGALPSGPWANCMPRTPRSKGSAMWYVVERTLDWLKGFRRLHYRVDRTAASFQAFVYLAILVLCVRRVVHDERGHARHGAGHW